MAEHSEAPLVEDAREPRSTVWEGGRRVATPRVSLFGVVNYRLARGENQSVFWRRFGISPTQGAKYERGHAVVPLPAALLVALHAEGVISDEDLDRVRGRVGDMLILE